MSFQNLNWHSGVEAASRLPLIPFPHADRSEPTNERTKKRQKKPTRPGRDETRRRRAVLHPGRGKRDFSGAGKPEPRFLWAKAARGAAVLALEPPPPPRRTKMNRSFHKSQPLRNVDCNAVEVKSKVGLMRRERAGWGWGGCWRSRLSSGPWWGGVSRVHMAPVPSRRGSQETYGPPPRTLCARFAR